LVTITFQVPTRRVPRICRFPGIERKLLVVLVVVPGNLEVHGAIVLGDLLVDDLEEVHIRDVKNKSAIGYWRCCHGVRVYKSKTVTNALRLICSAPVPGLEGISYLDVFRKLTSGADWEHHIYLFGGLVRDILRRNVGNDIDICFTAPALELDETCQKVGYKCNLDGKIGYGTTEIYKIGGF